MRRVAIGGARSGSIGRAIIVAAGALSSRASAQTPAIPVIDLPAATATSADRFGLIMNIRALPNGRLIVDDGKNMEAKLLSASLATEKVVLDSAAGVRNTYGGFPLPLIAYLGDSTLFPAPNQRGVLVIDPTGTVGRALAMPHTGEVALLRRVASDSAGRILFSAPSPVLTKPSVGVAPVIGDSSPLLRADLVKRTTDTIGYVARPFTRVDVWNTRGNELSMWIPDPLKTLDEWAVISDGSVAMVRGHDYHIDWVRPDGTKESTPKMPFEWKQLSDVDKQKLIDTVQAQWRVMAANNSLVPTAEHPPTPWPRRVLSGSDDPAAPTRPTFDTTKAVLTGVVLDPHAIARIPDPPTVESLFDYYPPMRSGAALADADNHLWILPTISKQSKRGELVYDVVNTTGELFERVRVPLGRFVVGFNAGGIVYMATGSVKTGFAVERTALPAAK